MPEVLYVPVLKGRQGELAALAAIQPLTRQAILPLLDIVPGSVEEPERPSQLRTVIGRTAKRLETWAGSRLLLDAGFLPPDPVPGDEFGTLGNSVMAAIDHGIDATLYDYLRQRRRLPRIPTFGDYAVTHPGLVAGLPYRSVPQLRYCVADRWLVLKGRLNDPRGHDQFFEICERIATHPDFVGAALGIADARIANPRSKGPGNAATWREVGTTHHLDFVVRRITTLDEP